MKNLLLGVFILLSFVACKPSAERDDVKYLGTWRGDILLDNGTYNYVKIELSGNDEFPYRITSCQFSGSSKKHYEFEDLRYKINDGRLVAETLEFGKYPTFQIKEKEGAFKYQGNHSVFGSIKNHFQ